MEELANLRVVTASRRPRPLAESASAVSIVTAEEVRRSGGATIPDAIRNLPGLQVSRIDADEWALAIRGLASVRSRSALVMIDGRNVWAPLIAGVFWDQHDVMLEDLDRIEIVRGPGGPLYGSNALNGVIHVVTKSAGETQGGVLALAGGSDERSAAARWGSRAGDSLAYRGYAKYAVRDGTRAGPEAGYDDEWRSGRVGFRADLEPAGGRNTLSVHGDLYRGEAGQSKTLATFVPPFVASVPGVGEWSGGDVVARWRRRLRNGGALAARVLYDRTSRREVDFDETRDTGELELEHRFNWDGRHDTVWGGSYRLSHGRFDGIPALQLVPPVRTDDVASLFLDNETRIGQRLRLGLGSKLEWNDYLGWNVQPGATLSASLGRHLLWASAKRGVRTASRAERDLVFYSATAPGRPVFTKLSGSDDFEPESVLALELGYRTRLSTKLLLNVAAFRNRYRDFTARRAGAPVIEAGLPGEPPRTVIPVSIVNGPGGRVAGVETDLRAALSSAWQLRAGYSYLDIALELGSAAPPAGNSPRHQLWALSSWDVAPRLGLDLVFRAIAALPAQSVPAHRELDARIAYRPSSRIELSVVGKNLLQPAHREFGGGFEVARAVQVRATLGF